MSEEKIKSEQFPPFPSSDEFGVDYLIWEALKCPQEYVEPRPEYPDDYMTEEFQTWLHADFKEGEDHGKT